MANGNLINQKVLESVLMDVEHLNMIMKNVLK